MSHHPRLRPADVSRALFSRNTSVMWSRVTTRPGAIVTGPAELGGQFSAARSERAADAGLASEAHPHAVSMTIAIRPATARPGVIAKTMIAATIAAPTSISSTLSLTAVRWGSAGRMDFEGEQDQPCQPCELQRPIGQQHVLRRLAGSAVHQPVVPEQAGRERQDRQRPPRDSRTVGSKNSHMQYASSATAVAPAMISSSALGL